MAAAAGLDIPAEQAERAAATLTALEEAFRPLVQNLPPELEPSLEFRVEEDAE